MSGKKNSRMRISSSSFDGKVKDLHKQILDVKEIYTNTHVRRYANIYQAEGKMTSEERSEAGKELGLRWATSERS